MNKHWRIWRWIHDLLMTLEAKSRRFRREMLLRVITRGRCGYCGKKFTNRREVTFDHKIPRVRQGHDNWENLIVACLPCNQLKNQYSLETFRRRYIGTANRFYYESGKPIVINKALHETFTHPVANPAMRSLRERLKEQGMITEKYEPPPANPPHRPKAVETASSAILHFWGRDERGGTKEADPHDGPLQKV